MRCLGFLLLHALMVVPLHGAARSRDSASQSEFVGACSGGDLDAVKTQLAAGADPNAPAFREGQLPLHAAISGNKPDIVRLLVKAGARLNDTRPTALEVAAQGVSSGLLPFDESTDLAGTLELIALLLSLGADPNAQDGAALIAAAGSHVKMLDMLVAAGGKPAQACLAAAARLGRLDVLNALVKAGFDARHTDAQGKTLLHIAMGPSASAELLDRLLALGVPLDSRDQQGRTALFDALEWNDAGAGCLIWLKERGADVNVTDKDGVTPLMFEAGNLRWNGAARLQDLLKLGAHTEARDKSGHTALDHAANASAWENVAALLDAKAKPAHSRDMLEKLARDSLTGAAEVRTLLPVATKLLDHARNLRDWRVDGWPALSWAVFTGSEALARLLLDAGADLNATDSEGCTPLMHAARIGAVSLRKWLQAAGADSKLRDRTGRTAGDWARTAEKRHLGASSGDLDDSRLNRSEFSREDIFSAIAGHRDEDVARRLPASPQALNSRRGGMDPVHLAAALGHESTLRLLLDHGASLGAATDDSLTVLTVAAQFHQMDLISAFSEKLSAPARKEQIGQLHSVWKQHREIDALKAMLLLGWEPAEPNDAQFAAQDAVRENDLPLLKRLLALSVVLTPAPERPDDPFQPDRAHENFLKLAAAHDDLAVLDYLLARLAVKEPQWHENVTAALHSASSAGRVPAMRLLVEKAGADVNAGLRSHHGVSNHVYAPKDKNVRITAISLALERGERESVDFLLARGARMQGCDSYSRPPLAAAVVSRDIGLVKLALEHRAELDAVSNEGRTALHEAAERGLVEIARLLMQRGINPSLRDKDKLTAAELARQEGQPAW